MTNIKWSIKVPSKCEAMKTKTEVQVWLLNDFKLFDSAYKTGLNDLFA